MFRSAALISFTFLAVAYGQQAGTLTTETHPPLTWQQCTASGSCTTQNSAVVLDANWRWLHDVNSATNCYTGNTWDATLCPDPTTCAANCALDGGDYSGTYGVTTSGSALTLKFVTQSAQKNVGSRLYLMAPGSTTEYQQFKLVNQEFTFDVDVSQLPCGLNGAVYFSQMDADGGVSRFPTNKAGANFGTGYCDSQCPHDIKFIDGLANIDDWTPASNSPNTGTGSTGSCCSEMDIWEANSISAAVTPHPCTVTEQTSCTGTTCSSPNSTAGVCDQAGCDFNSYRLGDTTFYGPGMTVDTTKPFTVVTQFVSSNNETTGTLSAIRRLYVQNGVVIQNSETNIPGITATNEITADFCEEQKTAFGDTDTFDQKGGLAGMGTSLADGMTLVLSIPLTVPLLETSVVLAQRAPVSQPLSRPNPPMPKSYTPTLRSVLLVPRLVLRVLRELEPELAAGLRVLPLPHPLAALLALHNLYMVNVAVPGTVGQQYARLVLLAQSLASITANVCLESFHVIPEAGIL